MQYLKGRDKFNYDKKLENLLENLSISNDLKKDLQEIPNIVASLILLVSNNNMEKSPYRQDNIGYSDKRSYLTFDNGKNSIKVGRFVNQLIKKLKDDYAPDYDNDPNKVPIKIHGKEITEQDIQKFVDLYNDKLAVRLEPVDIKVLKGDEIYKAYQYCGNVSGSPLSRSCMIGEDEEIFDIYTKNPEKVALATLWKDGNVWGDDSLMGRALLWNTDDGIKIMDRIYFDNADVEQKFKTWASKNGYAYREYQDYEAEHAVYFIENGKSVKYDYLSVSLKDYNYSYYPYMDTFKFLDDDKCLTNARQENSIASLEHTDGSYTNLDPSRDISKLFKPENMVDAFDDVYKNSPTPFGQPDDMSDKKIDDIEQDDLILVASNWSDFTELFEGHENESFLRDMLTGDGIQYFDWSVSDVGYEIDSWWQYLGNDVKDIIIKLCKDYGREEEGGEYLKDNNIFEINSKEEFKKFMDENKDLDFSKFLRSTKTSGEFLSHRDNYYKNMRYFGTIDGVLYPMDDVISEVNDFSEIKDAIKQGYTDAKRLADESAAYDLIIDGIVRYFGPGKFKVSDKIMIQINPDQLSDLLIDNLSEYDMEDFSSSYSSLLNGDGNESLVDLLSSCVRWYSLETPEFTEPYYGFDGDIEQYLDESVRESLFNNI